MTRSSTSKTLLTFVLAISILAGSIGWWPSGAQALTTTNVVVTGSVANLRSGPSTSYALVGTASNGQTFAWIKTVSGWYQVILPTGKTAYIYSGLAKLSETTVPDNPNTVVVTGPLVNLRSGPATSYDIVSTATKDQSLPLVKTVSGWYEVVLPAGEHAFIYSTLATLSYTAPEVPPPPAVTTPSTVSDADKPYVDAFRASFDGSLAQTLVGRAIWYMEYGYIKYGHSLYADTGYIDCSQYVSRVFGDFGYSITSASRKYTTVGTKVEGVYAEKISGTSRYQLVGTDKLRPGDIFTFWAKDSSGNKYISHVALFMGMINGKPAIINTVSNRPTAIGIVTDFSYWYGSNLYDVRRVLPDTAQVKNGIAINDKGPVIPAVYQMEKGPVILPKDLPQGF